jgi:adenylate cyclase
MALEIERRFFVVSDAWQALSVRHEQLDQGYLSQGKEGVIVRVRRSEEQAWLTLKAPTNNPEIRHEFEYTIPEADAAALLSLTPRRVTKTRHHLNYPGGDWVVDVFSGDNAPLVIAEVERENPEAALAIPEWCGEEITGRGELSNAALAVQPWNQLEAYSRGNRFS